MVRHTYRFRTQSQIAMIHPLDNQESQRDRLVLDSGAFGSLSHVVPAPHHHSSSIVNKRSSSYLEAHTSELHPDTVLLNQTHVCSLHPLLRTISSSLCCGVLEKHVSTTLRSTRGPWRESISQIMLMAGGDGRINLSYSPGRRRSLGHLNDLPNELSFRIPIDLGYGSLGLFGSWG